MTLREEIQQAYPSKSVKRCKIRVIDEEYAEVFNLTVNKIYNAVYVKIAPQETECVYRVVVFYKNDNDAYIHSYYRHQEHTEFTIEEFNSNVWWIEMIKENKEECDYS